VDVVVHGVGLNAFFIQKVLKPVTVADADLGGGMHVLHLAEKMKALAQEHYFQRVNHSYTGEFHPSGSTVKVSRSGYAIVIETLWGGAACIFLSGATLYQSEPLGFI
jgi:hypothetical protein